MMDQQKSCPIWLNFVKKCVPKMRLIARNGSYLFRVAAKITIQQSLYIFVASLNAHKLFCMEI